MKQTDGDDWIHHARKSVNGVKIKLLFCVQSPSVHHFCRITFKPTTEAKSVLVEHLLPCTLHAHKRHTHLSHAHFLFLVMLLPLHRIHSASTESLGRYFFFCFRFSFSSFLAPLIIIIAVVVSTTQLIDRKNHT